jgi:hypothetical protein
MPNPWARVRRGPIATFFRIFVQAVPHKGHANHPCEQRVTNGKRFLVRTVTPIPMIFSSFRPAMGPAETGGSQ